MWEICLTLIDSWAKVRESRQALPGVWTPPLPLQCGEMPGPGGRGQPSAQAGRSGHSQGRDPASEASSQTYSPATSAPAPVSRRCLAKAQAGAKWPRALFHVFSQKSQEAGPVTTVGLS